MLSKLLKDGSCRDFKNSNCELMAKVDKSVPDSHLIDSDFQNKCVNFSSVHRVIMSILSFDF